MRFVHELGSKERSEVRFLFRQHVTVGSEILDSPYNVACARASSGTRRLFRGSGQFTCVSLDG
jgi:hypothetical protein